MKKMLFVFSLFLASNVFAQDAAAPAPAPVEPAVIAPAAPTQEVAPIGSSQDNDSFPTYNRVDPVALNAKLGVGSSFGPQAFWMSAELEAQLDKFIAIGPRFQIGTNSNTDFILASVGPRFTVPFSYFEFGFKSGFGASYRNVAGFEFTNFLFESGINLDLYLFKNLSVGAGYNMNITSSAADTFMSALLFTAAGHF